MWGLIILYTWDASGRRPKMWFNKCAPYQIPLPPISCLMYLSKCLCSNCKMHLFKMQNLSIFTMHLPKMFFNKRVLSPSPHHVPLPPLWFTLDIHQNTHLKPSYLFKDPVTKDKSKVICIFRVQISNRTHFTSKYICFPSRWWPPWGVRHGSYFGGVCITPTLQVLLHCRLSENAEADNVIGSLSFGSWYWEIVTVKWCRGKEWCQEPHWPKEDRVAKCRRSVTLHVYGGEACDIGCVLYVYCVYSVWHWVGMTPAEAARRSREHPSGKGSPATPALDEDKYILDK